MSEFKGRMYNLKKAEWKDLEKSQPGPGRKEERVRVASEKLLAKMISSIKASQCFASQQGKRP